LYFVAAWRNRNHDRRLGRVYSRLIFAFQLENIGMRNSGS